MGRNGSLSSRTGALLMRADWAEPASSDNCNAYLGLTLKKRPNRTRKWSNAFTATKRGEKVFYRPFAYLTNYKWNISQIKAIMIGRSSRVGCSSQLGFCNLEKKNNKQENKLQRELKDQNASTFGLNSVSQLGRKTNTNNKNNI